MGWDNDIYYNPEKHGLTKLAEHELSEPCYSFDILACWQDADGNYYLGTDSGCSCPSPFESYGGVEDLTGPLIMEQAVAESISLRQAHFEPDHDPEGFEQYLTALREANHA